ncbi:MAG TPA: S41 family peptidase [bacterium]|nr:S41 family peptidase [bacterium]
MRKHKYIILVPLFTVLFCWTLLTDATEEEAGTLEYLELYSQCFELVQSRYLEPTDPAILAEGTIEGMLLENSHYSYLIPAAGESRLIPPYRPVNAGITIGYREPMIRVIDVIPGSPADEKGILPGDSIIRIGDQVTPFLPVDRAERMLTGNPGDTIELLTQNHLTREVNEIVIELNAAPDTGSADAEPAHAFTISEMDQTRLLRFRGQLTGEVIDQVYAELSSGDALPTIIDLRHVNRGRENDGIRLADIFLSDGIEILATCNSSNEILSRILANDGRALTGFPVIVIIDPTSSGPAETCAAALQTTHRATVIGDRSFGKAVQREIQPLDEAYRLAMVTGWFCAPDGTGIHRSGVTPDMFIQMPSLDDSDPYMATALVQVHAAATQT